MTDNGTAKSKNGPDDPEKGGAGQNRQRVISNPEDVAKLVMMQIDAINARKDDLTIAIKGLTDTTRQLVRAYAQQAGTIRAVQRKVKELEEKVNTK